MRRLKKILWGKRLQQCCLPERYGSVFFGMTESAFAESRATRRDGSRWFVPNHSTVYIRETLIAVTMAGYT